MDKIDKEVLIIFEESTHMPKLEFIKENIKTNKLFKRLIKLCIQFKIKLYEPIEDRWLVRSKEKIIKKLLSKKE